MQGKVFEVFKETIVKFVGHNPAKYTMAIYSDVIRNPDTEYVLNADTGEILYIAA